MKGQTKSLQKSKIRLAVVAIIPIIVFSVAFIVVCPKRYSGAVKAACGEFGLHEEMLYAVIKVESGFNRRAKSNKGAVGLMQILPSTAEYVCPKDTEINLYDPKINIYVGAKYLFYLFDKFKDEKVALAAYNAGEGNVITWLSDKEYSSDGKTLSYIPFAETRAYVEKVLKFKRLYKILYKPFGA